MTKDGIVITDRNTTFAMAHAVCAGLDKPINQSVLAMKLMKDTDLSLRASAYVRGRSESKRAAGRYRPQGGRPLGPLRRRCGLR
jgi:hypothetical protein